MTKRKSCYSTHHYEEVSMFGFNFFRKKMRCDECEGEIDEGTLHIEVIVLGGKKLYIHHRCLVPWGKKNPRAILTLIHGRDA